MNMIMFEVNLTKKKERGKNLSDAPSSIPLWILSPAIGDLADDS